MSQEAGPTINHQYRLNHFTPAAHDAHLGDLVYDLTNQLNALTAAYLALLAHMDTANVAGLGNANVATYSPAAVAPATATYPAVYPVLRPDQR